MFSDWNGILYFQRVLTVTSRGEFDVMLLTCGLHGLCCEGYGCLLTAKCSWGQVCLIVYKNLSTH